MSIRLNERHIAAILHLTPTKLERSFKQSHSPTHHHRHVLFLCTEPTIRVIALQWWPKTDHLCVETQEDRVYEGL
jgi:hypothetical protein